jgi:hypothetical protein
LSATGASDSFAAQYREDSSLGNGVECRDKEDVERNPVVYLLTVAVISFGLGFGAYRAILEIASLESISKDEHKTLIRKAQECDAHAKEWQDKFKETAQPSELTGRLVEIVHDNGAMTSAIALKSCRRNAALAPKSNCPGIAEMHASGTLREWVM